MGACTRNGVTIHYRVDGGHDSSSDGVTLVFANSLGSDLRIWDEVVALLPRGVRIIRYDKRGHGLSDLPQQNWGMADHVADLAGLLDHLQVRDAVLCGLSVGGMIVQGLAAERPDLARALILCGTGAKIGDPSMWEERVAMVREIGLEAMADAVMERWFTQPFREEATDFPVWRNMMMRTTTEGYAKTCQAIADTDLLESTSRLRLPCMGICGDADAVTPPDLVRETVDLVPGSTFRLIRKAAHIPCVEQPAAVTSAVSEFLEGL